VKVLSIKEKALAELDDEFAKGVGEGYDSLEALRQHIRNRLTEEAEAEANRELQSKSLEALVGQATIQASDMLYQRELESMQQEQERMLRSQRVDMDSYLTYIGKTEEEFQEELRPNAQERMTRFLVIRKLAQEEGIEVTPEEVQEEIDSMVAAAGESAQQMRRYFSSESSRENIRGSLLNRKVLDRLLEIVQGSQDGVGAMDAGEEQQAEDAASLAPVAAGEEPQAANAGDTEDSDEGARPNAEQPL
jgi:trigger factor